MDSLIRLIDSSPPVNPLFDRVRRGPVVRIKAPRRGAKTGTSGPLKEEPNDSIHKGRVIWWLCRDIMKGIGDLVWDASRMSV